MPKFKNILSSSVFQSHILISLFTNLMYQIKDKQSILLYHYNYRISYSFLYIDSNILFVYHCMSSSSLLLYQKISVIHFFIHDKNSFATSFSASVIVMSSSQSNINNFQNFSISTYLLFIIIYNTTTTIIVIVNFSYRIILRRH